MNALAVNELYRFFHMGDDETVALRGVSLEVFSGEIVAIVGPSGSGKSTLLACIAGLDEPDGGCVEIAGERMTRRSEAVRARLRARKLGIMLQSGNLFQHLTTEENLHFQMQLSGLSDVRRVRFLLASVGLAHRANALPRELSGGETARASLAVALTADPPLLIADEPTAEVDVETERRLIEHFEARRSKGATTLLATHSEPLARKADRLVRLQDGRVVNG